MTFPPTERDVSPPWLKEGFINVESSLALAAVQGLNSPEGQPGQS